MHNSLTMDFSDFDSISKINKMVENFGQLCCGENCKKSTSCYSLPSYTNFSMKEILRPDFGSAPNLTYDSDGTALSETSDFYSSCDEYERGSSPETSLSSSPQPLDLTKRQHDYSADSSDEICTWNIPNRFGKSRFHIDEDGYSSSDSEIAHALDLRVPRKKTPPKRASALPAWVFCTRYSARPSAGPRARRRKTGARQNRSRTAFNDFQLEQLNIEFEKDQYLSESRRQRLAQDLNLNEANVKIWFQNKRAKSKKSNSPRPLALQLQSEGLYNHKSTS